ncbi:biotin/lipoyl-containing protein [Sediminitomix flava]|uniref:Biotin-dependent enzyme n=1 Tax=Sediminitomix flava TaxID=379075 RepID=A0A315ZDJ3_SEDFL|nr:biotin/lipoyl-containing protein [Sediminitomix flava]PWJ43199.1 biotin-dependent enzyme [Sediminitomix flava]
MFNFFKKSSPKRKPTPIKRTEPAQVIRMPKMSDKMEFGVVSKWCVRLGDYINSGDVLVEVETDKATMELESYEDGKVLYLSVREGEKVDVNGVLVIIGNEGEDISHLLPTTD